MAKTINLQRRHFEFLADNVAPLLIDRDAVHELAEILSETNPHFKYAHFVERALKAYTNNHTASKE